MRNCTSPACHYLYRLSYAQGFYSRSCNRSRVGASPVGVIGRFSVFFRIYGCSSLIILAGWRTAFQLAGSVWWRTTCDSDLGCICVAVPFEMPGRASFFPPKALPPLVLWHDRDTILALHSDCPPWEKGRVRTLLYHIKRLLRISF